MPQLNEETPSDGQSDEARKSNAGSDRQHNFIDQVCRRQIPQSELADTQQRRAIVLAALAPFLSQEVRHG